METLSIVIFIIALIKFAIRKQMKTQTIFQIVFHGSFVDPVACKSLLSYTIHLSPDKFSLIFVLVTPSVFSSPVYPAIFVLSLVY
jgi:hypothetical protein